MRKQKGDVSWYLHGWYVNGKYQKPIAYSTVAAKDLIETLYEIYGDLRLVYVNIMFDKEAKEIVKKYLDKGVTTFSRYKIKIPPKK